MMIAMRERKDGSLDRHLDELAAFEPAVFDGVAARGHGVPARLFSEGQGPHTVAANLLVAPARQTGARVTFVENSALLAGVGGAGALLRCRL
jgi:hypothetical protein